MAQRKQLIREYKEAVRPTGVFQIHNKQNGKRFIGTSVDLPSILRREQFTLKTGAHRNAALQEDWETFGRDAFVFEVLEELEPLDRPGYDPRADLEELKTMWLEKLQPYPPNGYNPRPRETQ